MRVGKGGLDDGRWEMGDGRFGATDGGKRWVPWVGREHRVLAEFVLYRSIIIIIIYFGSCLPSLFWVYRLKLQSLRHPSKNTSIGKNHP